ncbi:hypothetical protein J6895_04516 [Nakaseomyces glabratus]|nr:hypothetical protein J6895_04516 [Nakaseomyces glabratus]
MSLDGIINGYTVLNLNHSSDRFTIYNAKDRNGSPCLLKVCHDGGSKQTAYKQATSDAMLESFIYNNNGEEIQCYIFPTSTLDYFTCNQSSNPTKSHQSRLKTLKSGIRYELLKTPTPDGGMQFACHSSDDCDDDDNDDDDDDDEEEEEEEEEELENSDSDSDEDEDLEVNIIVHDDIAKCPLEPILNSQNQPNAELEYIHTSQEHIHFVNNPVLQRVCHRQHRPIVRTPVPKSCPAYHDGVPDNIQQKKLSCQKGQFELQMLQSSMLKRRSTSSAGH